MKSVNASTGSHPNAKEIALYSGGDLSWIARWATRRHIARCGDCERQVLLFRSAAEELKREADTQTLTGFEAIADWPRIEREMLGNISVGLAAARCIDQGGRRRIPISRGALVVVGLAVLFVIGWFTHIPKEQNQHLLASLRSLVGMEQPQATGTIVQTTPNGIAIRAQGATLTILHPPSAVVSMTGASGVSARYVDEDTGEVTITKVYGQ